MSERPTSAPPAVAERAAADLVRLLARDLGPGLHVVATPIGNLGDITLRALATLAAADIVYCEDTRHSRTLVAHFAITTKLRPYHEFNAEAERPRILARLAAGDRIALISDAGTPLISDPGYKLVRDVIDAGHPVFTLPGPCAAIGALSIAGLPTDCFCFVGFLPTRSGQRQTRLRQLASIPATLVVYEAPIRVAASLADMALTLGDRPAVIAREITKLHEELIRGTLAELAHRFAGSELRGELAILVGPPVAAEVSDADIERALAVALQTGSRRDAILSVTHQLAVPRARVYNLATLVEQGE